MYDNSYNVIWLMDKQVVTIPGYVVGLNKLKGKMKTIRKIMPPIFIVFFFPTLLFSQETENIPDATDIIKKAVEYYRGKASVALVDMTIHRPDWERTVTIKAWTKGRKNSLFYIMEPPKDKGNGTLKKGSEMWTYNPKINRVVKLPPSMMSQAWMGSDFSNNDLAKSDSILEDYSHKLESVQHRTDHKVYVIQCIPKPTAPVVWGMQKLEVRDDLILLKQAFYDEDAQVVKYMTGSHIEMIAGKLFPRIWKMQKASAKDEYTQLVYKELEFIDNLSDSLFTLSSLKNPRR
jgi:outer membrane lipoprotein-sorting protein